MEQGSPKTAAGKSNRRGTPGPKSGKKVLVTHGAPLYNGKKTTQGAGLSGLPNRQERSEAV